MYVLADYHKACGVIAELPTGQQELQRCAQRSSAGSWCGLTCNLYRARSLPSVTKHAGGTCSSGAGMQLRGGVYRLSYKPAVLPSIKRRTDGLCRQVSPTPACLLQEQGMPTCYYVEELAR